MNSEARNLLSNMPQNKLVYILFDKMTEEEKAEHPEAKTTGGYLKEVDNRIHRQKWWHDLSNKNKNEIMSMPNFDKEIFKEITGIDVTNTYDQPV